MQETISAWWNKVFLGQHLDGVGDWMKKSQKPKSKNISAIGTNSVLHQGTLFALHPGEDEHKPHDHVEDEKSLGEVDQIVHLCFFWEIISPNSSKPS